MTLAPVNPRHAESRPALPEVASKRLTVPLVDGRLVPYANLDHAASAPCLEAVQDAVNELLPWYASVHRGAGFASRVSTQVYEQARDTLRRFVGAPHGDTVIFTRNTTDALNLLARALPTGTSVVLFDTEHHAALSVHKLYAPFGAGALIGRADWLRAAAPYLVGGGATRQVVDWGDHLGVSWAPGPERHEAGSPNVVGVHALAVACETITRHGW